MEAGIPLVAFSIVVLLAFVVIVGLLVFVYFKAGNREDDGTTDKKKGKKKDGEKEADDDEDTGVVRRPARRGPGLKKRGMGRMKRKPIREEEESSGDERVEAELMFKEIEKEEATAAKGGPTKKVGAKKQRKLEAKEAKKQEREVNIFYSVFLSYCSY